MHRRHPRRRRGLSLVEAAMVLAIAALVVGGIMVGLLNSQTASKTNDALAQFLAIRQATSTLYNGQPTYAGLSPALLAQSRQLPNRMQRATGGAPGLNHAFNGPIAVEPLNNDQNVMVVFFDLPSAACAKMATMDFGEGVLQTEVWSSGGEASAFGGALAPHAAARACGDANDAVIAWFF